MIAHDFLAGPYYPTELQPNYDGINFTPVNSLLNDTHERIINKVHELSKIATDYHHATMPDDRQPAAREVHDLIERISDSIVRGPDVLNAFSSDTRAWFVQTLALSIEWIPGWERICQGLIQAGSKELLLGDFLPWQERVQETINTLRRIHAAHLIEPRIEQIVERVSQSMQNYATRRNGDEAGSIKPGVEAAMRLFLTQWVRLLKFGSAPEIHLNTCRLWAEHFAPRFEFGVPEWQFLLALIDLQIRESTGTERHRTLAPFIETIHEAAPRLTFCGVLFRRLDEVETVLDPQSQHLPFKWQELVQEIVGEIVWAGAPSYSASPICTRMLQGVDVLRGAKADEFREFSLNLVNCCRPLCERNWLDWLDGSLAAILAALEHAAQRVDYSNSLEVMFSTAVENLREGREVFASHQRLATDLEALLDAAFTASRLYPDISDARRHFRSWFVLSLLARRPAEFWRHSQTMVRALATGARQAAQNIPLLRNNLPALEMLGEVVAVAPQADWLSRVWGEIDKVVMDAENPSCGRDVQWVLRKSALELTKTGQFRAAQEVAGWMLTEVVPFVPNVPGERFEQTYREVCESITRSSGALADDSFRSVLTAVSAMVPSVIASHRIWITSEGLGNEVARRVYAELPDYAESTGIGGAASCARDNALTLRRVAQALEPCRADAGEYLGEWWANLINAYVVNRPAGLFRVNCDSMLAVCAEQLTVAQGKLVENLVRPLFESAGTDDAKAGMKLPPFDKLPFALPFAAEVSSVPTFGWAQYREAATRFFESGASGASKYASRIELPAVQALPHLMPKLIERLAAGFPAWRWSGSLDSTTVASWREALEVVTNVSELAEALLHGWMQHTESLGDTNLSLQLVAYLQECIEFNRQCFAGLALAREAGNLGRMVADAIHQSIPNLLAVGVSSPKPERCARDLALVFKALGEGMSSLPRTGAVFHIQRCLAEQIAPHVGYGESVWRMVWMIASRQAGAFSPAVAKELSAWFGVLEGCGRDLPWLGMINKRLLLGEEPQFSSDPQEEWEWRKTVSALLVLHRFHPAGSADHLLLRGVLCASLPLLKTEDFGERLEAIAEAFKIWFVDVELGEVAQGLNDFRSLWESSRKLAALASQVPEINERLTSRLPVLASCVGAGHNTAFALNWFTFQSAWASLNGAWLPAGNRWGLPSVLRVVTRELLPVFTNIDPETVSGWSTALGNAFTAISAPNANVVSSLEDATAILREHTSLDAVWKHAWKISGTERSESCGRDIRWLARRISVDAAARQSITSSHGTSSWYLHEILPYAGSVSVQEYLGCFHQLSEAVRQSGISAALSRKTAEFAVHAPSVLASHTLATSAAWLAEEVVTQFEAARPEYFVKLTAERKGACQRDTAMTVKALAVALASPESSVSLRTWWHRTIAPYLSPHEQPILAAFRETIADCIGSSFEVPVAERADAEIADINGDPVIWSAVRTLPEYQMSSLTDAAQNFLGSACATALQYAADSTGERPAVAARLSTVLAEGYASFQWNGVLPAETTTHWCAALAASGSSHESFERYIFGLMQQTNRGIPATEALGYMSWLQEIVEYNRQCSTGLSLWEQAPRLSKTVAMELARAFPAHFGGAQTLATANHLRQMFQTLGRSMSRVARPVALLRFMRVVAEEILPHFHLEEKAWASIWSIAGHEAGTILGNSMRREFSEWCEVLEKCGAHLCVVSAIQRRLSDSTAVKLHENGDTAWQLRSVISLASSLALIPRTAVAHARAVAVGSLRGRAAAVLASATTAWQTVKSDYPDLDLSPIESELHGLVHQDQTNTRVAAFLRTLPGLHQYLASRLLLAKQLLGAREEAARTDGLRLIAHSVALAVSGAPLESTNRWGVPYVLGFCEHTALAELGQSSETEVKRLVAAIGQSGELSADVVRSVETLWTLLSNLGSQHAAMEAAWQSAWKITPAAPKRSFFSFGSKKDTASPFQHASCSRDLGWAARRIATDGWVAPHVRRSAGERATAWYASEIMPYAGAVGTEDYSICVRAIEEAMLANTDLSRSQREAANAFRSLVPRQSIALATMAKETEVTAQVLKVLMKKASRTGVEITELQKRDIDRDIRGAIREISKALSAQSATSEADRKRLVNSARPRLVMEHEGNRIEYFDAFKQSLTDLVRSEDENRMVEALLESL